MFEAGRILERMGDEYEYHYVTTADAFGKCSLMRIPEGKVHVIKKSTTLNIKNHVKTALNTLSTIYDAYQLLACVKPFAVVCIGTSMAIPLCFWGKYFRKNTIFVESITRIKKPSLTGNILCRLNLCDRIYVQWPEAVKLYDGSFYRGSVL